MQDTLRLLPALSPDSTVSHTSDSGTVSATPVAPQHQSAPSDLNICAQLSPEPLDPAAALPTGCPGASAAHICAAPGISADAAAALKCVSAEQGLLLQVGRQPSLNLSTAQKPKLSFILYVCPFNCGMSTLTIPPANSIVLDVVPCDMPSSPEVVSRTLHRKDALMNQIIGANSHLLSHRSYHVCSA